MDDLLATGVVHLDLEKNYDANARTIHNYKVLHVTPFFPPDKGGLADHVYNLCFHLSQQGNHISVIAPKHVHDKKKVTAAIKGLDNILRIRSFYLPGWPYSTLRSVSIPLDLGLQVDSIIRKGRFDLIHVHGHHYPLSWIALGSAHKHNIPSVLTAHGMYALDPNVLGGKSVYEDWFNKHILSRVLAKTTANIGLTKQVTAYLKQFGKKSTNYYTIGNGVNTSVYEENRTRKIEYRRKYGISEDSIVILFIGRFVENKGIIEFSEASKNIVRYNHGKKVEVLIVGDGPLESEVYSILSNVDRVHILKYQPHDEVHQLYITSDIFVIPSKFEGLPITVVEAMSAHLHIVYTSVGGIPDILEGYSSKTLLNWISSEEIQRTLTSLLTDFHTKVSVSSCSVSNARNFDWKTIAHDVNKVYDELKGRAI